MKPILFVVLQFIFFSCSNFQQKNPPETEEVIHLFYLENRNDEVLKLTSNIDINEQLSFENRTILKLIRAASFCENGLTDSTEQIISSIDTLKILNDKKLMFWYNSVKGLWFFRTNNNPQAFKMLLATIDNSFDDRAKALTLRLMARIHYSTGDANKASEWLAYSSELFTEAKLFKSVAINHKILGRYYANKKDFAKATERFEIAKAGLEIANDSIELFYIYLNLIGMQLFQGKYAEAKELANKNTVYITNINDRQALALLYNNQGEIEFLLHNYDSCRYFYHKTLELPLGYITDNLRRGNACIGISKAYMAENNKIQALQFAHQALQISKSSGFSELQYNTNLNLAELHQINGQFEKANYYLKQATQYLEKLGKKSVENSETVYQSTINLIELENHANKIKSEKRIYFILIIVGIVFTLFLLIYVATTRTLYKSRNTVLKALVKKNLQIIDEERKHNSTLHLQINAKKLTRKSTDEEKDFLLFNELIDWLQVDRRFTRKDLTTESVAREMGTNREYLSRAMSRQNTRLNELINKYRIEEVIHILSNKHDKRNNYSLFSISSEVGFNSQSVFFEAFRKQTGMSPAQFRETTFSESKDDID